jgi:hypothetical protein
MKEREHLYLEIPTYHDTVIILTSVLFIFTQIDILTYVQPYCFYRDSHHVLHKGDPDLSPVLEEILSIIKNTYRVYRGSFQFLHEENSFLKH